MHSDRFLVVLPIVDWLCSLFALAVGLGRGSRLLCFFGPWHEDLLFLHFFFLFVMKEALFCILDLFRSFLLTQNDEQLKRNIHFYKTKITQLVFKCTWPIGP